MYTKEVSGSVARTCYVKIIVNKADQSRVVGFHICAPNAGEITQGIAIGIKCGMTKEQLDSTVGIHPTAAEDCIGLSTTKEEKISVSIISAMWRFSWITSQMGTKLANLIFSCSCKSTNSDDILRLLFC